MADDPDSRPATAIDILVEAGGWPPEAILRRLAEEAVAAAREAAPAERGTLAILFSDDARVRALNARFRGKDKPTNVLSFPAASGDGHPVEARHLGDIALAYETVSREAAAAEKPFDHHVVHLLVHGFLHLVGYDHEAEAEAEEMEELERRILKGLAIGDPYA